MLAELMLPDQSHARKEDWTIFFLHKDPSEEADAADEVEAQKDVKDETVSPGDAPVQEDGGDLDDDGGEGPPLIYVLNLVNTKLDSTFSSSLWVPFLDTHLYLQPLLLLALEEYYKSPVPETLETLYNAVNSMDLSFMPRLSMFERHILLASDTKDMFTEKFEQMIQQRKIEEARNPDLAPDSPSKLGVEATSQKGRYTVPRDTHEFETKVFYNGVPVPIKVPSALVPETVGDFSFIKLIQTFATVHSTSPQPFALHPHLTTNGAYTHPIIVLVNALLTQKRVIFQGHNRPSGEVAEAVLAACALVSGGVLRGFTRHAFPYTDLTKIDDLLNVPGFVAGVTNPTFANHPEWWDLLCDLPTGRMKISTRLETAPVTEGLVYFQQQNPGFALSPTSLGGKEAMSNDPTGDSLFIEGIMRSINSRHGESVIRSRFREYIIKFARMSAAFEETVYGASALYIGASEADAGAHGVSGHGYVWSDDAAKARELGANVWRIEGWRTTRSYYAFIQDLTAAWERRPIRSIDLAHQHDRLRSQKLSHEDSAAIYIAFAESIRTYEEICQLLTVTPGSNAGLFYIGLGLFHPDFKVRVAAVELLERMIEHEAGRSFWAQLSRFAKLAFFRVKKEAEKRSSEDDAGMENGIGLGLDARVRVGNVGRAS
ncbi:uncharacterized protein KY384_008192 [Bacidia gigantensis]|uniref:uncharacterized protein n=1 Tax=Bacidia gigantensis TaxID=2732470 RepID=UPI001D05505E|nr:uncharacterized protein KY384_008192 [Bacidia gigantensis]KAG8526763.1 hypothetical protein KY384_008192 [Bacidia gigantensis]